jgi:hypothetical protein
MKNRLITILSYIGSRYLFAAQAAEFLHLNIAAL